jgi:hypothetical protein
MAALLTRYETRRVIACHYGVHTPEFATDEELYRLAEMLDRQDEAAPGVDARVDYHWWITQAARLDLMALEEPTDELVTDADRIAAFLYRIAADYACALSELPLGPYPAKKRAFVRAEWRAAQPAAEQEH